jgi:hypothetical protein
MGRFGLSSLGPAPVCDSSGGSMVTSCQTPYCCCWPCLLVHLKKLLPCCVQCVPEGCILLLHCLCILTAHAQGCTHFYNDTGHKSRASRWEPPPAPKQHETGSTLQPGRGSKAPDLLKSSLKQLGSPAESCICPGRPCSSPAANLRLPSCLACLHIWQDPRSADVHRQ